MAKTISGKFKQLRKGLKKWSKEFSQLNKLINNCSWMLAFMDGLEDQRALSLAESNFRILVKQHLQKLLEAKRFYCKQRSTVRWVEFGDENSKLFQALATHSFRRNSIPCLQADDGSTIYDHDLKDGLLWCFFKDRLGISEFTRLLLDLFTLITMVPLPTLDNPFSKRESDAALNKMPPDDASGPNGFNGFVMKKCWHIIAEDLYMLCENFYNGIIDLECINGSFITLIPKKDPHLCE
jgi:hypothetical protein